MSLKNCFLKELSIAYPTGFGFIYAIFWEGQAGSGEQVSGCQKLKLVGQGLETGL